MKTAIGLGALGLFSLAVLGCSPPPPMPMMTSAAGFDPQIRVPSRAAGNERVLLDLAGVTDSPVCATQPWGMMHICVTDFTKPTGRGLTRLMAAYATPVNDGAADAKATLSIVAFDFTPDNGGGHDAQRPTLHWKFLLEDSGKPVVQLDETTVGRTPFPDSMHTILEMMFDKIATSIDAAGWPGAAAASSTAQAPTPAGPGASAAASPAAPTCAKAKACCLAWARPYLNAPGSKGPTAESICNPIEKATEAACDGIFKSYAQKASAAGHGTTPQACQ